MKKITVNKTRILTAGSEALNLERVLRGILF